MTRGEEFDDAVRGLPRAELSPEAKERHLQMLADMAGDSRKAAEGTQPRRRSPRRRALVIAIAVLTIGLVGVGTAAAFGFFSAKPTDRRVAVCYATADLSNAANHFDVAVATSGGRSPTERDAAGSALQICAGAWQQGRLSDKPPMVREDPREPPWTYPVPALIVCVLPTGQVGVFPGKPVTCQGLGLLVAQM